ncbi:hypothetical protein [Pedobacter agri]|uniref:hypothetical protein n=1 Tax=Pedobacter agri TaxID=454586 RepID=UPI00278654C7|nr:hypothetical protein [Pedobacter agri]MDQ1139480.1 hypothetical protein [Pedobacter agri]
MKRILLILTLALPLFAFSQRQDSIPFVGATKIIIKNDKSAEDNYQLAAKTLLDQNYTIEKSDKEFHQLYSGSVKVFGEGTTRWVSLYVLSRDGSITIVGRAKRTEQLQLINVPKDTDNFETLPYKKNLLLKNIFAQTTAFAKSIGGKIIYSE